MNIAMAVSSGPIAEFKYMCFQDDLNLFLKQLSSITTLPKTLFFRSEDGSPEKSDFSLHFPFSSEECKAIEGIMKDFKTKFSEQIASCHIDSFSKIAIKLNRNFTYSTILKEVLTYGGNYGMSNSGQNINVLFVSHSFNASSLIDLRTHFIAQHTALILMANNYNIYFPSTSMKCGNDFEKDCVIYDCSTNCDISDVLNTNIDQALKSEWRVDLKNRELKCATDPNVDEIILDCKQYVVKEENVSKHLKNIGYLFVKKNGCVTNCTEESAHLSHIVTSHTTKLDSIIHIIPENKASLILKAGLLTKLLDNTMPNQSYLIHQGVFKNSNTVNSTDYIQGKYRDIKNSLIHKYGSDVMNDISWQSCVDILVNTEITFDLLLTRSTLPLKVNVNFMKIDLNEKGGTFVQYNCARLSMLFKHFEDKVKQNYYKPLPKLSDIDFSELKLDEEWNLFYNYIFPFPSLVKELVDQITSYKCSVLDVSTYKIVLMLLKLSRDLSIYYNKIRILVDPHPHLQKKMFARLYLLKSIHQVMKCALNLLNLTALDKM